MKSTILGVTLAAGLGGLMQASPAMAHVGTKTYSVGNSDTGIELYFRGDDAQYSGSSRPYARAFAATSGVATLKAKLAGYTYTVLNDSASGSGSANYNGVIGQVSSFGPLARASLFFLGVATPAPPDSPCGTGKVCSGGTYAPLDATIYQQTICGSVGGIPVCAQAKIDGYFSARTAATGTARSTSNYSVELIGVHNLSVSAGLDAYAEAGVGWPGAVGVFAAAAFNLIDVAGSITAKSAGRIANGSPGSMTFAWYNRAPLTISGGSGKVYLEACYWVSCSNIVDLAHVNGFSTRTDPLWSPMEGSITIPAWSSTYLYSF